ncbi:MAG: hypothetical protein KH334_01525 [Clostridiales bacterium]|nr:hypothetical protein [Clostridiales bacterium]
MHTISNMKALLENHPESGIYTGTLESGREYILYRQEGMGCRTSLEMPNNWFEIVYYDEDGQPEGVEYER